MAEYKATPEQWKDSKRCADAGAIAFACILELRARVEALEAANSKPTPNPSQIRSSLVERVRKALSYPPEPYARAAIREVAAWLKETHGWSDGSLMMLEQEVER